MVKRLVLLHAKWQDIYNTDGVKINTSHFRHVCMTMQEEQILNFTQTAGSSSRGHSRDCSK